MNGKRLDYEIVFAAVCFLTLLVAWAGQAAGEEPTASEDFKLEPIEVGSPERIEVLPRHVKLSSQRSHMQWIVSGYYASGQIQDLTRVAEFASSDESVVRVDGGVAVPVGDGAAEILVNVAGHRQAVPVEVSGVAAADPVSFHYETLAVLTKQGCNSGACHGSPSGKAGFRLSLLAYDAKLDELTLIRESYGRRTNPLAPESSLLLLKPTMRVSHGGGLRLRKKDSVYQLLKDWIGEGCQVDSNDQRYCVKLEVLPATGRVLKRPAHTQQLLVLAHFSDGTVRDVTALSKFSSSDEVVATVGVDGLVVGHDRGQAAIMVRFLEKVESCTLTFVKDIEGFAWTDPPENNYIDRLVYQKLRQLKYLPSDLCSDDEFIRRVYLDVIGILPTIEEVTAFLDDPSPDKRSGVIDTLLDRPEYSSFWALKWGDLLRIKEKSVAPEGVQKYYRWLVLRFENNVPFDQFCTDLLMAEGSTFANPAANYYRTASDMMDCAETTAQLFLGVRIQCAKCHNHPFERWTQDNYYGLAAFFNRVQRKQSRRTGEQVVWIARSGEVTQPRTGQEMKPWLPLTGEISDSGDADRRGLFAQWLTGPENPFFAKVAVNRIWAHVIGRGIVQPVDDFRDSNPPSNEKLLEALADDFRKSGFNRKHILRTILNSRTYQLSSQPNDFNEGDNKFFSQAQIRLLGAEQLLDAICHVTGVEEIFEGLPPGTRATQLPSPDVKNEFLKIFGQPARQTACACERSTESNLSQAIQLFNGPLIHAKLQHDSNRFRKLAADGKSDAEIVSHLYLAAVCRRPTDVELAAATEYIAQKKDRIKALEDCCWALLNTNEFLYQH